MAPVQQATQLGELYLVGPGATPNLGGLLPLSIKRLSWEARSSFPSPDLSHLTQATF
jgi:hypothetical protein